MNTENKSNTIVLDNALALQPETKPAQGQFLVVLYEGEIYKILLDNVLDKKPGEQTSQGGEIFNTYKGDFSNKASAQGSSAFGINNEAKGQYSCCFNQDNYSFGDDTCSLGFKNSAFGRYSFITGLSSNRASELCGNWNLLNEKNIFAAWNCDVPSKRFALAYGIASTVHGQDCLAIGDYSDAGNSANIAKGDDSFSRGHKTIANGWASSTFGIRTITNNEAELALGHYNKSNIKTIASIGIGSSDSQRCNAVEVYNDGSVYIKGVGGYDGTNPDQAKSLQEIIGSK